jgi:short-subunit dehydrogenase
MRTLKDKAVVITGSASGIGEGLAMVCAARGARLFLADIDEAGLNRVRSAILTQHPDAVCHTMVTDTGNEADIHALAQEAQALLGGADVLINNAGVALVAPVEKLLTADAHWLMNINFWGVVHGCKAFLPQMRQRPAAVLVNVSSIFAMVSMPTQSIYNASKAAVRGFSDALREELRGTSIRVLTVHPGGIRTNIANKARVTDVRMMAASEQEFKDHFLQMARTTSEQAAQVIVKAIESGSTRVLIGADATVLDTLYRMFPTRASAWLTRISESMRQRAKKSGYPQSK